MIKKATVGAGLMAVVAYASAPCAWAADSGSQTFLTKAIQGNLAEVSMGQLAQQKGSSDAVRRFGQTLMDDHNQANVKAKQAAQSLGVTAPTAPTAEQKSMHDHLATESGAQFDRDFADSMVNDHRKDIADYQAEASGTKDAASQYASETLPTLQKHLDTAQSLASNTGAPASTSNGEAVPPLPGANSFTEGQAKSRIEAAGFTNVGDLKKDDQGIWRGTASKGGTSSPVALDFKGNVVGK